MGMMATSELALALRWGVSVHSTWSGTRTKPPPTPSRPPSSPPKKPITGKTTPGRLITRPREIQAAPPISGWATAGGLLGRAARRFGRAGDHGVMPELHVRRHRRAGLLGLLFLFDFASLLVASFSHADQFP